MAERTVVSKVTNAVAYSDDTIRVDNVRFSYPHLDKPYESEGDDGKVKSAYGVTVMLPKETHTAAKDLVKKMLQALMTKNDAKVPADKWCLLDGDKLADEDDAKELYRGHFILKSSEKRRPTARDRKGNTMELEEVADEFYGGMWGNVLIRPWYFNGKAKSGKAYPKRLLANLIAVQKVRDDESFGEGRVNDDGVFQAVEGDDSGGNGLDDEGGL